VKRIFGFEKTRYRGLSKNHQRLCVNFGLANLYLTADGWFLSGRCGFGIRENSGFRAIRTTG
jgi:hypothetical protein